MQPKTSTYENTPPNGLKGILKPEYILNLQGTILNIRLLLRILEQIFLGRSIFFNVLPSELMDLRHSVSITLSPSIEIICFIRGCNWLLASSLTDSH